MPARKAQINTSKKPALNKQVGISLAQPKKWQLLVYGIFGFAMAYGFGSWAIETGSLWLYLFSFISLYYGADYLRKYIKVSLFSQQSYEKKHATKAR